MKAYVITTGAVFALLTLAHVWRVAAEGLHPLANPWFVVTTLLTAALSMWAGWLFRTRFGREKT
jgi:hypothetical protein